MKLKLMLEMFLQMKKCKVSKIEVKRIYNENPQKRIPLKRNYSKKRFYKYRL